jgi:hypothetical protein
MDESTPEKKIETACLEIDNLLRAIHEFLAMARDSRDIGLYQTLDYFFELSMRIREVVLECPGEPPYQESIRRSLAWLDPDNIAPMFKLQAEYRKAAAHAFMEQSVLMAELGRMIRQQQATGVILGMLEHMEFKLREAKENLDDLEWKTDS